MLPLAPGGGVMKKKIIKWLHPSSTVVEHLTHIRKVDSSNPATGTSRNGNKKNIFEWFCSGSIVVEHLTHIPKVNSWNPTTSTGGEKMAKKYYWMAVPW